MSEHQFLFRVGDRIHGFAGGAFGRDSYACRIVEAVGRDWIVTRNTRGETEFAVGADITHAARQADDLSYCHEGCDAT